MAKTVEEAKKKLDDEYGQVRRKFDRIHTAFDDRLKDLEKIVKEVRDGGVVGSDANGHRRALKEYEEAKASSSG
jgi:hypothetical protein